MAQMSLPHRCRNRLCNIPDILLYRRFGRTHDAAVAFGIAEADRLAGVIPEMILQMRHEIALTYAFSPLAYVPA